MLVVIVLVFIGLCMGSFVNALVWRVHEQERPQKRGPKGQKQLTDKDLSILRGRSMCPHCHHTLAVADLIPVLSWLWLRGRCRYCNKPISWQYPVVELLTAAVFVLSFIYWARPLQGTHLIELGIWLILLVGLVALLIYDLRWMLLPNRIMYSLIALAILQVLLLAALKGNWHNLWQVLLSVGVGGGFFYVIFQISDGRWIGGGDVKLGFLIGLVLGDPLLCFLALFLASLLGVIVSLPLLVSGRLQRRSRLPFGPFLIVALIIVRLCGVAVLAWARRRLLI